MGSSCRKDEGALVRPKRIGIEVDLGRERVAKLMDAIELPRVCRRRFRLGCTAMAASRSKNT